MLEVGNCVAVLREDGGWETPCFVEAISEDGQKFTVSIFNTGQVEVDIGDPSKWRRANPEE